MIASFVLIPDSCCLAATTYSIVRAAGGITGTLRRLMVVLVEIVEFNLFG